MHFRCRVRKLFGFFWVIQCARVVFWCRNDIPSLNQQLFHSSILSNWALSLRRTCAADTTKIWCAKCQPIANVDWCGGLELLSYIALIYEFKYHRQTVPARCQMIKIRHATGRRATQEHIHNISSGPKCHVLFLRRRCWCRSRSHRDTTRLNGKSNQKRQKCVLRTRMLIESMATVKGRVCVCSGGFEFIYGYRTWKFTELFYLFACLWMDEWDMENYFFLLFCCWIGFDELADRAATACIGVRSEMKEWNPGHRTES